MGKGSWWTDHKNVPTVTANLLMKEIIVRLKHWWVYHLKENRVKTIRSLRSTLDKILMQDFQPKFVYTGTKLSAKFQIRHNQIWTKTWSYILWRNILIYILYTMPKMWWKLCRKNRKKTARSCWWTCGKIH